MSQNVKVERTLEFRHKGGGAVISTIDVDNFANVLLWRPETDDTGYISIGDGTKDFDVQVCLNGATKYVLFDVGNTLLKLEDVDLHLGDNDKIEIGDASGGDVSMVWNGSKLNILPATDDTGYIAIGDGTTDMDVWVTLNSATKYVQFDAGNAYFKLSNVELYLPNLATSASPTTSIIYMVAGTRTLAVS